MDDLYLAILGSGDRQRSEEKYAHLFRYFCRFFEWRGCEDPEDLAQTVFTRAIEKIRAGGEVWSEDIGGYLYGFARKILQEQRKVRRTLPLDGVDRHDASPHRMNSTQLGVLIKEYLSCLEPEERQLLLDYIDQRRSGKSSSSLRIRVYRIRRKIEALAAERKNVAGAG